MLEPILTGRKMDIKRIGGIGLFRPRLEGEVMARKEAEKHLREGYACGICKDPKKINEIIQSRFTHFYKLLHTEIPKSASRHLMEFLLGQYDQAAKITVMHKADLLPAADVEYWTKHGPCIRRALKHLAEVVTMLAPPEVPALDPGALPLNLDTIVICGELLVELYIMSDQTYGIHSNDTILTIHPEGQLNYLQLEVQNFDRYRDFPSRINRDTARQKEYLPHPPLRYDLKYQAVELDGAFLAEFGFGYKEAIQALMQLIDKAVVPDPSSFDVPFVRREVMIDWLQQDKSWRRESIERLLDGFSLTKTAMQKEGRLIFKPKQEYRALHRGFFEMPHETGTHLAWSRTMARVGAYQPSSGL